MQRFRFALFVLVFLPLLMGADTITLKNFTSPKAQMLDGNGEYDFIVKAVAVAFHAQEQKTGQVSSTLANFANKKWDGQLFVVAGTYDGWAVLHYENAKGGMETIDSNTIKNVVVK